MKTDNKAFLPHFLEEEIYIIGNEYSEKSDVKYSNNDTIQSVSDKKSEDHLSKVHLTFSGNNSNGVLILVNKVNENDKEFLSKILSAVSLKLEDCALIQTAENNSPEHILQIKFFEANIILNFGTNLYDAQLYQIHPLESTQLLNADTLESISADKEKKKLLWASLQALFPDSK